MKLNDKKYGIEIEFTFPNPAARNHSLQNAMENIANRLRKKGLKVVTVNRYYSGYHEKNNDMTNWCLSHDGSIEARFGESAAELISPPLKGEKGLKQIQIVLTVLNKIKAKINNSCGLHVHHGIESSFNLRNLTSLFIKHQDTFYDIIKNDRKIRTGYCKPIQYHDVINCNCNKWNCQKRYYALNYHSARNGHIEFRLHHGTLKFVDIKNWIILTQTIVEASQGKTEKKSKSPILKKVKEVLSSGPIELNSLYRRLKSLGFKITKELLDRKLKNEFWISRLNFGDKILYMASTPKNNADELIHDLKLTGEEMITFVQGKFIMKQKEGEVA